MNWRNPVLLKVVQSRRNQTLADQVLVSGSNFLTGIILVRGLGLTEFGRFSVAYSILLLANGVQLSFISSPMITLGSLCPTVEERLSLVRGIYGVQLIFCAIASLASVVGTAIYVAVRHTPADSGFLVPFALAVVAFLMQDWLRRYYFTVGKAFASLWNDVLSYVGQVVVLLALWGLHRLTMNTALWSIALTSGAAFAMGAVLERLGSTRALAADAWQRARHISVDLGISNQLQWLVYQGAMLVGAAVLGDEAAGAVRATQNVVGPVNIAYQAMENIVPVRAAEEMRRGGIQRASAFLFKFGAAGFVVLLVLFSIAAIFSNKFLSFFYGNRLNAYGGVLNLQLLYFLLAWPIRQVSFLFRTTKNTRPILIASILAAGLSLTVVYPALRSFGAIGIMIAALAGQIVNLAYLLLAWARSSASQPKVVEAHGD